MAKIAIFDATGEDKRFFKKKLKEHDLVFVEDPLSASNASKAKDAEIVSVFIHSDVSKNVLTQLPKLKAVVARSTGFDNVDVRYCKSKKIAVCNVPFYGENTVAEHTLGLILSLSRNIHKSYVRTLKDDFSISGLTGFDLKDKIIGIIGGGHIGMHVARMARAFGMHVRVFDMNHNNFMAEAVNFKYLPMEDLLKTSDIVTLHVPYNVHTHHLIDKKKIDMMKRGAILINTARGGVVDTDALFAALKSKKLGGAGLDVIEGEELISEDHELLFSKKHLNALKKVVRAEEIFKMDNVVFTPHNAFNSKEAKLRILQTSYDNMVSILNNSIINNAY